MRVLPVGTGSTGPRRAFEKSCSLRMGILRILAALFWGGTTGRNRANRLSARPGPRQDDDTIEKIAAERQPPFLMLVRVEHRESVRIFEHADRISELDRVLREVRARLLRGSLEVYRRVYAQTYTGASDEVRALDRYAFSCQTLHANNVRCRLTG